MRYFYTLYNLVKHHKDLRKYRHLQVDSANQLTELEQFSGLVLDFDGVLASHGELQVDKLIVPWLQQMCDKLGYDNVFILSNKPMPQRIAYFAKYFPGVTVVVAKQKKPYPHGLLEIKSQVGDKFTKYVMVDDRLLTGILAAEMVGIHGILIRKPLVNFAKNPWRESFFQVLRCFEYLVLKII